MDKTKSNTDQEFVSSRSGQWYLVIPFESVVVLLILGCLLPEHVSWGFNYWGLFDFTPAVVVLVIALVLIWPPVGQFVARGVEPVAKSVGQLGGRVPRAVSVGVVSVLAVALLYLLRSRALVYGDGFAALAHSSSETAPALIDQHYLQLLSIMFHRWIYLLASRFTDMPAADIFGLTNAIGGMIGLWAIYRISRMVTGDGVSRAFVFLGALGSGAVMLFFGYIENYTWALVSCLWVISFAIGYHKRENGLIGLIVSAVIALAFHLATLPILVVALVSVFIKSSARGNYVRGVLLTKVGWLFVAASVVAATILHLLDFTIQVPMWPMAGNSYWFFSGAHLTDVLNQLLLVAPLGFALSVFGLVYGRRRAVAVGPEDGILGLSALLFFLAAFWIDPTIGAVRDWDLLAFYGFPLMLWALLRFTKYFAGRRVPSNWLVAAAVLFVVGIGPNLMEKNRPEIANERVDRIVSADAHYQSNYDEALRAVAWSVILQQDLDRDDLTVKYLARRLKADPDNCEILRNIGSIYALLDQGDSALKYGEMAYALEPDDLETLTMLMRLEFYTGQWEKAVSHAEQVDELSPDDVPVLTILGIAHSQLGRAEESLPYFRRAAQLAPQSYEQLVNLGRCFASVGSLDSTQCYVSRAFALAPVDKKPGLCCILIAACLDLKQRQEAANYIQVLEQLAPGAPEISSFKEQLANLPQ